MPGTDCQLPSSREFAKYQTRSLRIGPPTPALKSHSLSSSPGVRRPGVSQFVGVVAADHAAADARDVDGAADRVAAGLRHDVHRRAADLGFAESAGRREADLLRVADVGHVARHAAAAERCADVEAVDLQAALGAAAAGTAEHDEARRHLITSREPPVHRRHELEERAVRARGRQGRDDVAVHRRLATDALHVHDRRFAGDRDRLLEAADAQVGVDGAGERSRQLDAFAPDGVEAGQRERDRVRAGSKIDDAVLAGAVGDGRPDLLDQCRAGGFDSDAGQHCARRVLDDAGDRGLRMRQCGREYHG